MVGPSIHIRGATKRYALGNGRWASALEEVELEIPGGAFVALMGPNGSGKTTLLRAIEGSITLDQGSIEFFAAGDVSRSSIVHVSQDPDDRTFSRLTLAEHFLLAEMQGRRAGFVMPGINRRRLDSYRETLCSYERQDLVPFLDRPLSELSGGMRQAASLLVALAGVRTQTGSQAGVVLLDEPTASLDADNERKCLEIVRRIRAEGYTIALVTHDPRLAAETCSLLVLMHQGRVVSQIVAETGGPDIAAEIAKRLSELSIRGPDEGPPCQIPPSPGS